MSWTRTLPNISCDVTAVASNPCPLNLSSYKTASPYGGPRLPCRTSLTDAFDRRIASWLHYLSAMGMRSKPLLQARHGTECLGAELGPDGLPVHGCAICKTVET